MNWILWNFPSNLLVSSFTLYRFVWKENHRVSCSRRHEFYTVELPLEVGAASTGNPTGHRLFGRRKDAISLSLVIHLVARLLSGVMKGFLQAALGNKPVIQECPESSCIWRGRGGVLWGERAVIRSRVLMPVLLSIGYANVRLSVALCKRSWLGLDDALAFGRVYFIRKIRELGLAGMTYWIDTC